MENEVNAVKAATLRALLAEIFLKSDSQKEDAEKSSEIAKKFERVDKELDEKEQNIRIGRLIVSKEKNRAIKKVKIKEGSTIENEFHESNNYIEEDKEITK